MRHPIKAALLCTVLAVVLGSSGQAAQAPAVPAAPAPAASNTLTVKPVTNFVPVTDAMMRSPKPEDWLMYRGNYAGWAYSQLENERQESAACLVPRHGARRQRDHAYRL
jgi:opacity protein-like surface antigen